VTYTRVVGKYARLMNGLLRYGFGKNGRYLLVPKCWPTLGIWENSGLEC